MLDNNHRYRELGVPYVRLHDTNWPHPREVDVPQVFPDYYNSRRPHRGLGNVPIGLGKPPPPEETRTKDGVACDVWLGGLLRHYRRAA
jgi:hypothetical protein